MNSSDVVALYRTVIDFRENCRNKYLGSVDPEAISLLGAEGCRLLAGTVEIAEGLNVEFDWRPLSDADWNRDDGSPLTGLRDWCRLLDADRRIGDGHIPTNHWQAFCESLIAKWLDGDTLKSFSFEERQTWEEDESFASCREFLRKSDWLVRRVIDFLEEALLAQDVSQNPDAVLALVEQKLKSLRTDFLGSAQAVGPYDPTDEHGLHNCEGVSLEGDIGDQPGTLKCESWAYCIDFTFASSGGAHAKWSYNPEVAGPSAKPFEELVFLTWDYSTGRQLFSPAATDVAQWVVIDVADLHNAAHYAEEVIRHLLESTQYAELARQATAIITNGAGVWRPGIVEWTYVRSIDDVIRSVRLASEAVRSPSTGFKSFVTSKYAFRNEGATWRIIVEGSQTTVKDLKGMRYIRYLIEHPNSLIECCDIERARSRVQKAVNAAKRAITKANEYIGHHFEAVNGEGTAYIYKPTSPIPWNLE